MGTFPLGLYDFMAFPPFWNDTASVSLRWLQGERLPNRLACDGVMMDVNALFKNETAIRRACLTRGDDVV